MTIISVKMKWYECWVCGTPFGLSEKFAKACEDHDTGFYCPKGCHLGFGESRAAKLQRQLDAANLKVKAAQQEAARAMKQAKRYKCPDCTRDFATASGVKKHQRLTHMSPLALTKDAGPSAFNSKIN